MSIHQALQLAYALEQQRTGRLDCGRGSDQILGQQLLTLLRFEQATLRESLGLDRGVQIRPGRAANPLQVFFRQALRRLGLVG